MQTYYINVWLWSKFINKFYFLADMDKNIKCTLCKKPIDNYNLAFNHLEIDEYHAVDICQVCVDKFVRWQQSIYAKLFPTTAMKKIFREKK